MVEECFVWIPTMANAQKRFALQYAHVSISSMGLTSTYLFKWKCHGKSRGHSYLDDVKTAIIQSKLGQSSPLGDDLATNEFRWTGNRGV